MTTAENDVIVPLDVPKKARKKYMRNYVAATRNSGRLMLFAGDQKIEHLNDDFYGEGISEDDHTPDHFFNIASKSRIGVFATQLGLIARYGMDYPDVNYLIKINSKTHLIKKEQRDPLSNALITVQQVADFKKNSRLNVVAVGYTVYIGSEFEAEMMREAAQVIYEAHQHGLFAVLWLYPRGKGVTAEKDPHLIAGAVGVAACLGADFVKVNYPKKEGAVRAEIFKEAVLAAGRTKVICAGGSSTDVQKFLQDLHDQIFISGADGNATGRNIHQKSLDEAVRMCNAVSAITFDGNSVEEAMHIYEGQH